MVKIEANFWLLRDGTQLLFTVSSRFAETRFAETRFVETGFGETGLNPYLLHVSAVECLDPG